MDLWGMSLFRYRFPVWTVSACHYGTLGEAKRWDIDSHHTAYYDDLKHTQLNCDLYLGAPLRKLTSLTISASLTLSVALIIFPVANSLQKTDELSTQEIKESLSLVPSSKILQTQGSPPY